MVRQAHHERGLIPFALSLSKSGGTQSLATNASLGNIKDIQAQCFCAQPYGIRGEVLVQQDGVAYERTNFSSSMAEIA